MQLPVVRPNRGKSPNQVHIKEEFKRAYKDFRVALQNSQKNQVKFKPLLSAPDSNAKLAKKTTRTAGYELYSLFLAPSGLSGYNMCPWASDECIWLCLNSSGRGAMKSVQDARIRKTKELVDEPYRFMQTLLWELYGAMKRATKTNGLLAVRLNGTSDRLWEVDCPFLEDFSIAGNYTDPCDEMKGLTKFRFYDYTKLDIRSSPWYDFTLSYSGQNWEACEKILSEKTGRVAVVFEEKLPDEFKGFKVINGDLDDYRFLDQKGIIIGLKYKKTGREQDSFAKSKSNSFVSV